LGLSAFASNESVAVPHGDSPVEDEMDTVTAKETELAFQEALREELPGYRDMELIAAKPPHITAKPQPHPASFQGMVPKPSNAHVVHSTSVQEVVPKPSDDHVSEFEKDVTDLVLGLAKGGAAATPFGGSVQKIKDVIVKDMMPKVQGAHAANQKELVRLAKSVEGCVITKNVALRKAIPSDRIYKGTSKMHKTCRTTEAALHTDTMEAWTDMKAKKKIKEELCKSFSLLSKKLGEQQNNRAIVAKSNSEAVETYVKRITRTFCGAPGGKGKGGNGKGGFLDQFLVAKEKCEVATKAYNGANTKFIKLDKQWHAQRLKCDNIQDAMDGSACKHAVAVKDACETFEECWKDKKEAYDIVEKTSKQEEVDRKAEWRGLKRMLCVIDAFADGKVDNAEILKCKSSTHSVVHLSLAYPKIKPMDVCETPALYPYSGEYKKREFTPLPALAKGKVDANECSGMIEISTEPAAGSPSGCKCDRVTLNGPYSTGALVKCTNCRDIRRSKDKNSCPQDTKLFSPQGRTDWDTFLKSAGPLRAPHWVIDVTRPQNGCGGCTRYFMNSKIRQQSTWRTSDGSPWWLRSTRYNEPNGDYHANCYLDLWRAPKNSDSVTWNDGSCSYHSKSYYCQSKKISLTPKPGSPSGCVCKKVEIITGRTYSPGMLLKCTNCLKVRRSSDKNSCPVGTKVFAPRSREDWKAFIGSSTPLRAPHWIIDVTRPQNGCGGCTRHPMNSGAAAQATWRTADGSAWWLRSSRYNEPNGDYRANCYLDLWHSPANENSVTFNDANCNYHSISYYCQTVKGKKKKKSRAIKPPWKAR
jgi:hypothetical protein